MKPEPRFRLATRPFDDDVRVAWHHVCDCPAVTAYRDGIPVEHYQHAWLEVGREGLAWVKG